jgi:hypothetical protein
MTFINEEGLPPISEMINAVRLFIWKSKGVMVNIALNMEDESAELNKLIRAYRIASGQFQHFTFQQSSGHGTEEGERTAYWDREDT